MSIQSTDWFCTKVRLQWKLSGKYCVIWAQMKEDRFWNRSAEDFSHNFSGHMWIAYIGFVRKATILWSVTVGSSRYRNNEKELVFHTVWWMILYLEVLVLQMYCSSCPQGFCFGASLVQSRITVEKKAVLAFFSRVILDWSRLAPKQ